MSRGELTAADREMFSQIGVSVDLLRLAHVERVTDEEARAQYGINGSGDRAGIIFPYFSPLDGRRWTARLRRDAPEMEHGKPVGKYLSPYGDRRHIYFPPDCNQLLVDTSVRLVWVEAEKSVLAGTAWVQRTGSKLLFVGTGGCWGWRGRIGKRETPKGDRVDEKGPLPDLDLIAWTDREVVILFDANAATNPEVRRARFEFAHELANRGAKVRIGYVPVMDRVNGPDDMLAICGDESMTAVLETAAPILEVAADEAEAAIVALEESKANDTRVTSGDMHYAFQVLAAVDDQALREQLAKRAGKAIGIPKAVVLAEVHRAQLDRDKARKQAGELVRRESLKKVRVNPVQLIRDLETFFAERAFLPAGAALLLAYWALNTWTYEVFDTVPYLSLESATPCCGKSTVVRLLKAVCRRAQAATSITEAVMFRFVHQEHPTFLIDEAETIEGRSERAEALRAIAHEGYKQGGQVARIEGDDRHVEWYDVYCPKLFAAIGGLTGALLERCHVIHMEKAPKGVPRKPTRTRQLERDAKPVRKMLEAYGLQAPPTLQVLYESEPDAGYWPTITDREAELWSPLLYHARLAGADLEKRLLAVVDVFGGEKAEIQATEWKVAQTIALLEAISKHDGYEFTPTDLVDRMADDEAWARSFADVKGSGDDARAGRAAKVGYALRNFRLKARKSSGRMRYSKDDAVRVLSAHVPQNPPQPPNPPSKNSPSLQVDETKDIGETRESRETSAELVQNDSIVAEKRSPGEQPPFDVGAMALVEARLRAGLSIAPHVLSDYQRWIAWLDSRKDDSAVARLMQ